MNQRNAANETTSLLKFSNGGGGDKHNDHDDTESSSSLNNLYRARRILYFSHCFAQLAEIAWQFCLTMFLAAFTDFSSLFLVSSYGLMSGLVIFLSSGKIGKLVDSSARLSLVQILLVVQNSCVVLATICSFLLLTHQPHYYDANIPYTNGEASAIGTWLTSRLHGVPIDNFSIYLLVCIHVCGVFADCFDKAFKVAIEKDWIVVMSSHAAIYGQDKSSFLRETNVGMKQIDLSCKVVAPALAGILFFGSNLRYAAVGIGIINVLSIAIELGCTDAIYRFIPGLSSKDTNAITDDQNEEKIKTENISIENGRRKTSSCLKCVLINDIKTYIYQPMAAGGLALSLLYLNILSFGTSMTAYLVSRGMRMDFIGILRGISCAIGLSGTVAFQISAKAMSLRSTGLWAIILQFGCLSLSYFSLYLPEDSNTSLAFLIVGVCLSRIGLWVFDITVSQLMQESINEEIRGLVGGIQNSMNAFFGLLAFGLGLFFPDPSEFHVYVLSGYSAVGLAMLLWIFGVYKNRP